MRISVVIIVRDEAAQIERCLESAAWADEIIIVDTGSTDGTVDICKKYTDKIYNTEWIGFGPLKNFAVSKASEKWILNIDADERISPGLKDEIISAEGKSVYAAYSIFRRNIFMNRRMRFGGLWGERRVRLFKKDSAAFTNDIVHEFVEVRGITGKMRGYIEHRSYRNLEVYFQKFNLYTSLIAGEKFKKGQKFSISAFFRIPFEFIMRYFFKLGFLDGVPGFIYASISSFYAGVKYFKLYELRAGLKE